MPVISVKPAKGRTAEQKQRFVEAVTTACVDILDVKPEWVTVLFDEYERGKLGVRRHPARDQAGRRIRQDGDGVRGERRRPQPVHLRGCRLIPCGRLPHSGPKMEHRLRNDSSVSRSVISFGLTFDQHTLQKSFCCHTQYRPPGCQRPSFLVHSKKMFLSKCDDETSRQRVRSHRELRELGRSRASLLKKASEQHIGIRSADPEDGVPGAPVTEPEYNRLRFYGMAAYSKRPDWRQSGESGWYRGNDISPLKTSASWGGFFCLPAGTRNHSAIT